jgi:hypothetical protein
MKACAIEVCERGAIVAEARFTGMGSMPLVQHRQ